MFFTLYNDLTIDESFIFYNRNKVRTKNIFTAENRIVLMHRKYHLRALSLLSTNNK